MTPFRGMFFSNYERYWESLGHPPERMLANEAFFSGFEAELEAVMIHSPHGGMVPKLKTPFRTMKYHGVRIDCVLPQGPATLRTA